MDSEGVEKVGVIGLGIIGTRVAGLLAKSGRHVYVWSRTPKPVPNFLGSPAEMARLTDVIQLFVTDGEALIQMAEALREGLGKKHTVVNCSTSDPESVVEAYQIVKDTGASFLDAPFTGSKEAAEKGALVYYTGGDPKVLDKMRPILEVSAKEVLYLGRVGEASLLKIATNMIAASTVEALAEAYGLIHAAGIDPDRLIEALEHNGSSSPLVRMKLPGIVEQEYETHFSLNNMFKDIQYALQLGKRLNVEMPASSTTANVMFRQMQKGLGDFDFSVVAKRFQEAKSKKS